MHEQICKTRYKMSLDEYLKQKRAVRVKIHDGQGAVESYDDLTDIQRSRVNSVLCKNQVFTLVTFVRGVYNIKTSFMRPIRSL